MMTSAFFLCSLFTIIINTFSQTIKSKNLLLNKGYFFKYGWTFRLPFKLTVLAEYWGFVFCWVVFKLQSKKLAILDIISNKLWLFKLTVFWTKAKITEIFLVLQFLLSDTRTVKHPSLSIKPDNQALELKGE